MGNTYQSHMHEAYKDIILPTCCLYLFELCQILWPLWVAFHTLMIENHVHTTSTWKNFHTGRIAFPYHPLIHILFDVPYSIKSLPKLLSSKGMSYVLKKKKRRGHMKAHEKKWTHEGPCKNKKISHAQNIRRERQNHGTSYPLAFYSIHHIFTHMHFLIMVVWLAYSLGPIFDFAKYSEQACLGFSPCLELHKQPFRSRRKKAHKKAMVRIKHLWANKSVIQGTCFYFSKTFQNLRT